MTLAKVLTSHFCIKHFKIFRMNSSIIYLANQMIYAFFSTFDWRNNSTHTPNTFPMLSRYLQTENPKIQLLLYFAGKIEKLGTRILGKCIYIFFQAIVYSPIYVNWNNDHYCFRRWSAALETNFNPWHRTNMAFRFNVHAN